MGVVDLAVDADGRTVACKRLLLHGSAAEMHRARQRIRREATALERLRHPNIVPLLDVVDDNDDVVLVLPFLPGGTLAEQVQHHGPLSPGQVHLLADHLFDALAEAHRHGIVHRDIKPANVLFDAAGTAFLTDFGVASIRDATGGLTVTGAVIGTPEFMAPEQARGEPPIAASDVFSLAATLVYAATGHPPYGQGEPAVILQRAARGRLSPLPSTLDRSVRRRLVPHLARSPQKRPSAAVGAAGARAARDAGAEQDRGPVVAGPGGTRISAAPPPPRDRRRWIVAGAVAALAAVVVGATAVALANRPADGESAATTVPAPTTAPCTDLPYQPCGQLPSANTDGQGCLEGFYDLDGRADNGCEVRSDPLNGTRFDNPIIANLVPDDAVDRYPFTVKHDFNLFCDNKLTVTLTGPVGVSMQLDVLRQNGSVLGSAISDDGVAGIVELGQPDCFGNDLDLVARVSWVGSRRSGGEYTLTRKGSW